MKKDSKMWLDNTPIEEFRQKFGFSDANPRTRAEINKIRAMSRKINGPDSCRKVLGEIGSMLKGRSTVQKSER